jgi:hypothetical protein
MWRQPALLRNPSILKTLMVTVPILVEYIGLVINVLAILTLRKHLAVFTAHAQYSHTYQPVMGLTHEKIIKI